MKPRIAIPEPHSQQPDYVQRTLPQYEEAVKLAGGEPVRIPLEADNHEMARLITQCDAVLLPGSPADINPQRYGVQERHPQTAPPDSKRDNADELLLQDAHNMHKPVLGICYGMQSLNVWRNGKLLQHVESHSRRGEKRVHTVRVEPGSLLESIVLPAVATQNEAVWVNSSHHQAVEAPGDGLRVVARAEDGVVEAVEGTAPEHFVLGVQWHPERTVEEEPASLAIFRALVEAARRWQEKPRHPVQDFESLPR